MVRISSTLGAAIWEHVRAKCKTQKYLKFKSAKCQKMSQHCSMSRQYLACAFSTSCLATVLSVLQKARKKKPSIASTASKHAGPPCGAVARGLVVCALPSVHGHRLCVRANSPWAPMRHLAGGLGVPHAEQTQGCGDKAAAGQDFHHPARISHFSLHPGAAH